MSDQSLPKNPFAAMQPEKLEKEIKKRQEMFERLGLDRPKALEHALALLGLYHGAITGYDLSL